MDNSMASPLMDKVQKLWNKPIIRGLIIWSVIWFAIYLGVYFYSNSDITISGYAMDSDGKAQPNLLVVAFIDGIEVGRTVSWSTKLDGQYLTQNDIDKGYNFLLTIHNFINLKASLPDFSVYIPAKDLRQDYPKYLADRLQVIALNPYQYPSPSINLSPNGTPDSITEYEYEQLKSEMQNLSASSKITVFWHSLIYLFITAIFSIVTDLVSSHLEKKFKNVILIILIFIFTLLILSLLTVYQW